MRAPRLPCGEARTEVTGVREVRPGHLDEPAAFRVDTASMPAHWRCRRGWKTIPMRANTQRQRNSDACRPLR